LWPAFATSRAVLGFEANCRGDVAARLARGGNPLLDPSEYAGAAIGAKLWLGLEGSSLTLGGRH
jgi:hypothetical protein